MKEEQKSIFRKIIERELTAEIIYENERVFAFKDIYPVAPVHILVIPKKQIKDLDELEIEDQHLLAEIFGVIQIIVKKQAILKRGYRVVLNTKEWGGQTVNHLHFHLLGGRKLTWPPG